MKNWGILAILAAIAAVWYVMSKTKETFVPEFLDQTNVAKTAKTMTSSYAQETNHVKPTPSIPEPIPGLETPFRVNMYNSYMT